MWLKIYQWEKIGQMLEYCNSPRISTGNYSAVLEAIGISNSKCCVEV
jgi:hypothetical protein